MADQHRAADDALGTPKPEELNALLPAYEVKQLVARGSMGAVYLGRQKSLDRDIALKVLPRKFGSDPVFRASFEEEARTMARLRHPNLIEVHDFGEIKGYLYLIMDFVDGKSLHHSARGRAIAQKTAAQVVLSICKGLAQAHKAGIAHRDLKPSNILIGSNREPRIGDFGLVGHSNGTEDCASPQYSSPEAMQDPSKANERSDVYSVGVILYELLTGELPGESYAPPSRTRAQKVDARFDKIVRRAMHPAPGMRFASAGAMARELEPLLDHLDDEGGSSLLSDRSNEPAAVLQTSDEGEESHERAVQQNETLAAMAATESRRYDRLIVAKILIIAILLMALLYVWSAYNRRKEESERRTEMAEKLKGANDSKGGKNPWANLTNKPLTNKPQQPAPPQPREWTLGNLQDRLLRGERSRFPEGTWDLPDRKVYFVGSAMSWGDASKFAEAHGAHLATVRNEEERAALISRLPEGKTTWLGGGMTGAKSWGWVDGTTSALSKPVEATGRYLNMSGGGTIRALAGKTSHPFFLQWHLDGRNPGSFNAQLQRFNLSIDQRLPAFPPGTVTSGERHYLVVERRLGWEKARDLAREANGHLAIPGNQAEHDYLGRVLTTCLKENMAAWLGGYYTGDSWRWVTKEPWSFTAWSPPPARGLDPGATSLCFTVGEAAGWDNMDPALELPALVIEWSKDQFAGATPPPGDPGSWTKLRNQCTVNLTSTRERFLKLLKNNGTAMKTALENWYNALALQDRGRLSIEFQQARAKVAQDGRISEEGRFPPLPAEIGPVCNAHLREQRKLDQEYAEVMETARKTYVQKLGIILAEAQRERRFAGVIEIENELEAVDDIQSFVIHFKVAGT
uniref:Serine/threonine protein kinase n=1 Tax=uncultured verrucomicrobium HF0500_18J03 TaxID=723599 RepID=E7C5B2_9BACT|nr:serine/threonine protein kinase [uncultured verrucomicrobium HF0500_18J03]